MFFVSAQTMYVLRSVCSRAALSSSSSPSAVKVFVLIALATFWNSTSRTTRFVPPGRIALEVAWRR